MCTVSSVAVETFSSSSSYILNLKRPIFFDADDEFLSDCSVSNTSPSVRSNFEAEVHALRVNLFDEIEKGKRAEKAVARVTSQWQRMKVHLSRLGLSFPAAHDGGNDPELDMDSVERFCQEIVVSRFVSEAIGKGQARAETEAVAEAMIESKDKELSRLRNKVNYYEAANHEMSRRNQEVVEVAQKQQHKRKTKQRWIWTGIGLSVSIGVVALTCFLLPETCQHTSSRSADASTDVSGSSA